MSYRFARQFGCLLATLFFATAAAADVRIGEAAPDFTGTDALTGKEISLSDYQGKLVVLEWHNPLCPFVKKFYSVGAMQHLQENANKRGVVWISINSSAEGKEGFLKDDATAVQVVRDRNAKPTHYLRDPSGSIGTLYGAKTTPHMYVIDTKGKLAYMGAIDDTPTADSADIATAKNYVTRALSALTEGSDIAVKSTRPYGCFVKYAD